MTRRPLNRSKIREYTETLAEGPWQEGLSEPIKGDISPRDRIHAKVCPDDQCVLEYAEPGDRCKTLDHLLDQVETAGTAKAYRKLLSIHMDALLTHGGQVAQGVALGVKTVHEMLPADAAQTAVVEFAESTPGEQS